MCLRGFDKAAKHLLVCLPKPGDFKTALNQCENDLSFEFCFAYLAYFGVFELIQYRFFRFLVLICCF